MAQVAIVVNGMPGSGKTTLAEALAELLGCPFISKDAIKEPLADIVGPMISSRALGAIAMDTMWSMAGAVENGVVVESVLLAARGDSSHLASGIERAGHPRFVEVWCDIDRATAEQRLRDRYEPDAPLRHDAHGDLADLLAFWDEHESTAAPIASGPVTRVDTRSTPDLAALVQEIAAQF